MLLLAGLAYAVLSSAVIPALPTIQRDLHTTETGVTWVLTGFLLSASVGTSIIGRLGDMYGKERLLLYTLLVLARGHAAGGAVQLAGGADRRPRDPGGRRRDLPARVLDRARRVSARTGRRQHRAVISAILGVGGGVGLVLGAVIVEHLSWHWLFWVPLAVTLLAAVAHVAVRPRIAGPLARPRELAGGGADERGICCVLIAIAQTTRLGLGWDEDDRAVRGRRARCARPGSGSRSAAASR